jgi:ADP-heptose:LPS heptosyltransferase
MVATNSVTSCLVIKNDGLGDLVITSGIIAELSKFFNGQLDLVTCEENRDIVELMDGIRQTFYVSRDGLRFWPYISRLGIYLPRIQGRDRLVLKKLKKKKYDVAIVLRRFIRQNTLIIMAAIKAKEKYCTWQFPTNTTHKIARRFSRSYIHLEGGLDQISEQLYYQNFLEKIIEVRINSTPRLKISVSSPNKSQKNKVGICLGGHSVNWPAGYWIDFIKGIQSRGYGVVLFGGKGDTVISGMLSKHLPGVEDKTGKLSIKDSIEYLREIQILIGNDTGFSHLASLVVDKVLVIMGGGTFKRYFPWNSGWNQYIIYFGMPCFDCDWECRYSQKLCVNMIRPDNLLEYFDDISRENDQNRQRNLNSESCQYQVAWKRRPGENLYLDCQTLAVKKGKGTQP